MLDSKAKMHQNRFWLGLRLHCPSRPSNWNKGDPLLREGKRCKEGKERRERGRQGERREGKKEEGTPCVSLNFP